MTVNFLAVVGPTASGKSSVALDIAERLGGEIVCCDSVQLYKGFDIGSAKPSLEERARVPHYLFDTFAWSDPCDAAIYASRANQVITEIQSRGRLPIVTGGTGLYLRALAGEQWHSDLPKDDTLRQELSLRSSEDLYAELQAKDPRRAASLHPNDRFRVIRALEIVRLTGKPVEEVSKESAPRGYLVLGLNPPRAVLHKRIGERTLKMLSDGLISEVESLLASGVPRAAKPMQSIGYFEVAAFLAGEITRGELTEKIAAATRQYAKRQCTWFKKVPNDWTLESSEQVSSVAEDLYEVFKHQIGARN